MAFDYSLLIPNCDADCIHDCGCEYPTVECGSSSDDNELFYSVSDAESAWVSFQCTGEDEETVEIVLDAEGNAEGSVVDSRLGDSTCSVCVVAESGGCQTECCIPGIECCDIESLPETQAVVSVPSGYGDCGSALSKTLPWSTSLTCSSIHEVNYSLGSQPYCCEFMVGSSTFTVRITAIWATFIFEGPNYVRAVVQVFYRAVPDVGVVRFGQQSYFFHAFDCSQRSFNQDDLYAFETNIDTSIPCVDQFPISVEFS